MAEAFRRVAAATSPAPAIAAKLPADLGDRIGIHIRLSDKIVSEEGPHEMSLQRWKRIEAAGLAYIDRSLAAGERFFVCSEDSAYRNRLLRHIRDRGGDAIVCAPSSGADTPKGFDALVDFFALARCRRVVQMTRYSNFSIAAAIIGNVELVNFDPPGDGGESQLAIWDGTIAIRRLGDEPAASVPSP